jgi:hypothetical protein
MVALIDNAALCYPSRTRRLLVAVHLVAVLRQPFFDSRFPHSSLAAGYGLNETANRTLALRLIRPNQELKLGQARLVSNLLLAIDCNYGAGPTIKTLPV